MTSHVSGEMMSFSKGFTTDVALEFVLPFLLDRIGG